MDFVCVISKSIRCAIIQTHGMDNKKGHSTSHSMPTLQLLVSVKYLSAFLGCTSAEADGHLDATAASEK